MQSQAHDWLIVSRQYQESTGLATTPLKNHSESGGDLVGDFKTDQPTCNGVGPTPLRHCEGEVDLEAASAKGRWWRIAGHVVDSF